MNGKGENKGVVYCEMQVRDSDIAEEHKHYLFSKMTKSSLNTPHHFLLPFNSLYSGERK